MSERPVFDQINLVVRDMAAMVEFYERLGVSFRPTIEPWTRHHRSFAESSVTDGFDFDLDSQPFAAVWDEGIAPDHVGPVFGFKLPTPEAVDRLYEELTAAGYAGQKPPTDEFMGARYAVVADPDGNPVGLMGPIDRSRARMPPSPEA